MTSHHFRGRGNYTKQKNRKTSGEVKTTEVHQTKEKRKTSGEGIRINKIQINKKQKKHNHPYHM